MHQWFRRVVAALVETLTLPVDGAVPASVVREATWFVCRQHEHMPDYLRWPFLLLTLLFDLWPLLRGRARRFQYLKPADRQHQVTAWRCSRLGFRRDFIRFYEGLSVFAVHSLLEDEPAAEGAHATA
jgi:hypothetical protein